MHARTHMHNTWAHTRAHTHEHTQPRIYKYVFYTTHILTGSLSFSPTHRFKLNSEEDWVYGVQSVYNIGVSLFKEKCSKFYIEFQLGHKRSGMQSSLKWFISHKKFFSRLKICKLNLRIEFFWLTVGFTTSCNMEALKLCTCIYQYF